MEPLEPSCAATVAHRLTTVRLVLSIIFGAALWIAALWLLHGIARSVRRGDPFVRDNVRRLRAIGILHFPGLPLVCGLGAFVLAQVFAHGVQLRDDVAATI